MDKLEYYRSKHYIHKSNWLRAAILGANDGILSTSSLSVGIVASNQPREVVVLTTVAGIIAGALSMAAGEYVSVSSQTDIEKADIERERKELEEDPVEELNMLTYIYEKRGLKPSTARLVAKELTDHNALEAHIKEELGINEITKANPLQASIASGMSFLAGGALPLAVTLLAPMKHMEISLYAFCIVFLGISGAVVAKTGGTSVFKQVFRICFWGTIAMVISVIVGNLFGVKI